MTGVKHVSGRLAKEEEEEDTGERWEFHLGSQSLASRDGTPSFLVILFFKGVRVWELVKQRGQTQHPQHRFLLEVLTQSRQLLFLSRFLLCHV